MSERVEEMIRLYEEGMSLEAIGRLNGISRQRVHQLIGGTSGFKTIKVDACVYPNIRKWMNHNKVSRIELTRLMYGVYTSQYYGILRDMLKGSNCRKHLIDKLLDITGLTYEQAFSTFEGHIKTNELCEQCAYSEHYCDARHSCIGCDMFTDYDCKCLNISMYEICPYFKKKEDCIDG